MISFFKYFWFFLVPLIVLTSALRLTGHDQLAADLADGAIIVAAVAVAVTWTWLWSRRPRNENAIADFRKGESYWQVTDERGVVVQRGALEKVNLLTGSCTLRMSPDGRQPDLKPGYKLTTVMEGNRPIDSRNYTA